MELAAELLVRARKGDRVAQGQLVRCYQDRVYAVCRALVGNEAEDCAQDTFIKVLAALPAWQPGHLGAFILRVARNHCIDRLRTRHPSSHDPELLPARPQPELLISAEAIRLAVAGLPEDQRSCLALYTWGELEYAEIAEIEGVPVGTIRSRLSRAREALKAILAPELEEVRHAGR